MFSEVVRTKIKIPDSSREERIAIVIEGENEADEAINEEQRVKRKETNDPVRFPECIKLFVAKFKINTCRNQETQQFGFAFICPQKTTMLLNKNV